MQLIVVVRKAHVPDKDTIAHSWIAIPVCKQEKVLATD